MSDVIVERASLAAIEGTLFAVAREVQQVQGQVHAVEGMQAALRAELHAFAQRFESWVQSDAMSKRLQLATTRVVEIRQELERSFRHYPTVRSLATGVLQAVDAGLADADVVRTAAAEQMLGAPGYWLAPAIVALGAWVRDERDLATRAVGEALRRDDYKASLFFALIARRTARWSASRAWMQRYFRHQDPTALDREFVVMLDSIANGVFGPESVRDSADRLDEWLIELRARPGFIEAQEARWTNVLHGLRPAVGTTEYPALRRVASNWRAIEDSLRDAALHAEVERWRSGIIDAVPTAAPSLARAVDELLVSLVTNFDDDELPLRQKERFEELVIEADGDTEVAQRRFALEQRALEEKVGFTELLTNAAMFPEQMKASRATQRYAIGLSRDWIVAAYDAIVARARTAVPRSVQLSIAGWEGSTTDGRDERALIASLGSTIDQKRDRALTAITLPITAWIALGLGVAFLLGSLRPFSFFGAVIGAAGIAYWFFTRRDVEKRRQELQDRFAAERKSAIETLSTALAEYVNLVAARTRADADAEAVRARLLDISPQQLALTTGASPRPLVA